MTSRTVDALCDQFVEDYAALDPVSATAFGVAVEAVEAASRSGAARHSGQG